MKGSGMIKHAREMLCMSQAAFGVEIAERLSKEKPFHQVVVAGWESGTHSPRRNVRVVCCHESANWAIVEIERITRLELTEKQATEIMRVIVESQS
ncbi:MAG: hypothetical protein R8K20_11865 [Gallionellaceae bacterium]